METKNYTDIEQSKKLAKILPFESADMEWINSDGLGEPFPFVGRTNDEEGLPCWSLAALLDYLKNKNKFPEIKELSDGRFKLTTYIWNGEDCIQVSIGDTIVDACYEMIIKLHELKKL